MVGEDGVGGCVIEAVVFDMDGVLIDSEPVWERVRRRFVADHGGRWADDTQDRLMGMSTAEWSAYLASDLGITGLTPQQVAEQVIAAMADEYSRHLPLLPGAIDAVRVAGGAVAARGGELVAAVARSRPCSRRPASSPRSRRSSRARRSRGASPPRTSTWRRPTGSSAAPTACAAVEDSSNGLRAAAAAGLTVIAIPRPEYPPAADALAAARLVLPSLTVLTPDTIEALS